MKWIFKIGICLMLLVILTAEDCGFGHRELQQAEVVENQIFHELEDGFISDELNQETLHAMEMRAIQKFHELFDYLNIYADSGIDIQFRKHAREMIAEAFISEEDLKEFLLKEKLLDDSSNVRTLNLREEPFLLTVDAVQFNEGFKFRSNTNYKGQIKYSTKNTDAILGVQLKKTLKMFGNENMEVWELFFEL